MPTKFARHTGGRAAEEVVFNEITTGASNDIEQATKLARAMITRYGMSDEFDMVALETVNNQYLGGDTSLACSAQTQQEIDKMVVQLVKDAARKGYRHLEIEPQGARRAGKVPLRKGNHHRRRIHGGFEEGNGGRKTMRQRSSYGWLELVIGILLSVLGI